MGRIAGSFGVQGWVKVRAFTETAASLAEYEEWIVRSREGSDDSLRARLREVGRPGSEAHHGGLEGGGWSMKHFDVVTIFPAMMDALADHGITARSLDEKRYELKAWDPRDFTKDAYRRVDDRPYGGGPGMVMLAEPLMAAIGAAKDRQRGAGVERPQV